MINQIEGAIISTLKFYDQFEFPLTNGELYDYLWGAKCELHQFDRALNNLVRKNQLKFYHGFYFLPGRSKLVEIRNDRYLASFHKWEIIKKWRWLFGLVPFVKLIGISNTLGYCNAKEDGDIDLLVITANNRLFVTRTILTAWLWLAGKWRHGQKIKNRFCLSFYLTENNLDLSKLKTRPDDIYLIYWIKWFKPIWCTDQKTAHRFVQKNTWIKQYLKNIIWINQVTDTDKPNLIGIIAEWLLQGSKGDWLEKTFRNSQLNKIRQNTSEFSKDGVMAKHNILKFHPLGKRAEYYQNWRKGMDIDFFS